MITALWAVFWFIITFSILVVLHEGGHFLVARSFGVHVHEFMIGLPGPAIRYHGKQTDYGITAIPLGGYVRIAGMEPGPEDPLLGPVLAYVTRVRLATTDEVARDLALDLDAAEAALTILDDWNAIDRVDSGDYVYEARFDAQLADDPTALLDLARSTTYRALTPWQRVMVLSAGVVVNLLSAILVFVLVLSLYGIPTQTLTVDVALPSGGAAAAGIKSGETIKAINGKPLSNWDAMLSTLGTFKPGDTISVTVQSPTGANRQVVVTLHAGADKKAKMGVQVTTENVRQSVPTALKMSLEYVGLVFKAIAGFFRPSTFQASIQQSTGVIGVAVMAEQAAGRGPIDYAFLVALLSLSLGAMNILPIPPLDGGKVALEIVEAVSHRQLSRKVTLGISLAGTLLLVTLIGYLMYADVVRVMTSRF
jgi:regulator of sigma E protease